ncbi:hypothetical protein [Klenkia taihuensis]|uniref:Tryptophan-associated transmembrane protein (Trp_oprn_chp) n=1 Tax=Klenkia taihuensis TaxID=1225127 RepID=A0A1I1H504_9ACTN|nr:hypothetical protein [Klenkia taihuensis]GHE09383.1 hypothetical protein GCM10011381_13950 [Klenkia taihuensis]SFC19097.1 hypothetical protein SAMN05661030_0340 [Klenkia taihuensis]
MSHPPQPWDQPAQPWGQPAQPRGQQPPPYPPQQAWGQRAPARPGGGTALLVLGLLTAVLGLAGAVLPSYSYPQDVGWSSPLAQRFGDSTQFLAAGLVLLTGLVLVAVGSLVQRGRALVGTGLALVGAGMVGQVGIAVLVNALQVAVTSDPTSLAVGGVLLALAGCAAVATVVVGLVRLARLR